MTNHDLISFIETSMRNLQSTIEFSAKYNSPINFDSGLPAPFPSAIVIFKGEKDGTSK